MTHTASPSFRAVPFPAQSSGYLADPYAYLRQLRREARIWFDPGTGYCFLLRFDDVEDGLTNVKLRHRGAETDNTRFPSNPFWFDGPGHAGPRRVIMPRFSNRALQRFRTRAQEIVDSALIGKERGGDLRVVEEIGFKLPYQLTCDILGVPEVGNTDELRDWTGKNLELIDAFLTPEKLRVNLEASACVARHLSEVIEWKRAHLADDVISLVIAAADEGDVMQSHQIEAYVHTLYLAGMHTTVNQTALSLLALLEHRDQWDRLRADPTLLENAVEELLRFEPTAQYMRRISRDDYEIAGVTIPADTEIVCWIASANRDEEYWGATVDELDITRADANKHIAFGKGPHVCVGSWLARLELQVAVGTIVDRFPNTRLVDQPLRWESNVIRGPGELVVELRP